jgi:glucan phosphoethanolaminetransferase (alkaline phosphatase superfamily)
MPRLNDPGVHLRMKIDGSLRGRVQLWCAWVFPVCLSVAHAHTLSQALMTAVICSALAGLMANLPSMRVACATSALALPFTIWWCGFTAIDGAGPGFEAARAVFWINHAEALGASALVVRKPAFDIAAAGHCLLLAFAWRSAWSPEPGMASSGSRRRHLGLLLSLLPLTVLSLLFMDDFYSHKTSLFGPSTLESPLGSAFQILVDTVRVADRYHELGYRRRMFTSAVKITDPVLAIFVLGESARSDAYGPNQTMRGSASGALSDRIARGLGAWLPTTCAASDGTHLSVPLLLTATPPERRNEAPSAPTILGILKGYGFSTAWLSNNEAGPDVREAGHDLYAGRWSINPDQHSQSDTEWVLDEDMLPVARKFIGVVDRPKALILHTFGNHIGYKDRYPAGFFPSEPSSLSAEQLEDLRYARAAEYGARTILEIADLLDTTSAPGFLVYTSDHGENLPSDHNGIAIHLGPRTTREDGTVPSFVLWNEAMARQRAPEQVLAPLIHAKMIAHADVARVFLALAGVRTGPVEPTINPTTWGRVDIGDEYSPVPCSALRP